MKKYQYRVERINPFYQVQLDEFFKEVGLEGWELVLVTPPSTFDEGKNAYYFKREIVQTIID